MRGGALPLFSGFQGLNLQLLEGVRYTVVVSCLLCSEAFVRGVTVVSESSPLLKLVHAILSLLGDERIHDDRGSLGFHYSG